METMVWVAYGNVCALNNSGEDCGGACGNRYTLCGTDELAVELGNYETDSLGSAGGVGNDVSSACSCSSEVTLSVGAVEDHLVACVSVNGAHDTALDGSILVESISHGSEAVGGAGSSGDDLVLGSENVLVYAEYNGGKILARGSGDNPISPQGSSAALALA